MFDSAPLPAREHTSRSWLIHHVAKDFRLLDVWALPTPGGAADFPRLVALWADFDATRSSPVVRGLFAARSWIGRLFGLDRPESGLGQRVDSLRDRLPAELLDRSTTFAGLRPFTPMYLTDDEFALEIANQTMHGVLHVGWVADGTGRHRGQMAVLVRPNGFTGRAYLAAIAPFRHLIVYPLMLRDIGRAWRERKEAHR